MGVTVNQYFLLGVKIPFKTSDGEWFEKIEPFIDNGYKPGIRHHKGLAVIHDGMNGEWEFIGRILARSNQDEHLDGPFSMELPPDVNVEMLAELINAHFPELGVGVQDIKPWFFTWYH